MVTTMRPVDFTITAIEFTQAGRYGECIHISDLFEPYCNALPLRTFPTSIPEYTMCVLDITLTSDEKICLLEANGSNANLTSIPFGSDKIRSRHMYLSLRKRCVADERVVALLGITSPRFMHAPEFFARAKFFAAYLSSFCSVRLCMPDDNLRDERISVVCGCVSDLADNICVERNEQLFYRGRHVAFASNANLLPELVRRGLIARRPGGYDVDHSIFHESMLTPFVLDKRIQQEIAGCAGMKALRCESASSHEECLSVVRDLRDKGIVSVGKISAGSGATGVQFFPASLTDEEAEARLQVLISSAKSAYGPHADCTAFPVNFFEFARSSPCSLDSGVHLWDIRMLCLVYPGSIAVLPCIIRICPSPFDGVSYNRESVCSNLSQRRPSIEFARSPMSERALSEVGLDQRAIEVMACVCAQWCEKAWAHL